MLVASHSSVIVGIDAILVRIEADASPGTPAFAIIGLPDRALSEARDRVRAAIVNSGFGFPPGKLLVNMAPADIHKAGPRFDLPIALALLATDEQIAPDRLHDLCIIGELALDGSARPVRGTLPTALTARAAGFSRLIVPAANAAEGALIDGIEIYAVEQLADAVAIALGHGDKYRVRRTGAGDARSVTGGRYDYADVRGQAVAKRALEIAAAGGHHAVLVGPPGCGKTMLAQRLPSILPSMTLAEALDVTKIASIADERPPEGIARTRPFRAPHHTTSAVALAGGGKFPRPGEISLAQHGVLYLDEIAEFSRSALEVLRQPLEDGAITIARAAGTITYPARFTLVASMNPCPCGYHGSRTHDCRCDDATIAKYLGKLSGPLLDRIDLHITLARVPFEDFTRAKTEEPSAAIRARVEAARERQAARFAGRALACNAALSAADLRTLCPLGEPALALLQEAMKRGTISARAFDRVTRVARTIADLAASDEIRREHVAEALHYRLAERSQRTSAG